MRQVELALRTGGAEEKWREAENAQEKARRCAALQRRKSSSATGRQGGSKKCNEEGRYVRGKSRYSVAKGPARYRHRRYGWRAAGSGGESSAATPRAKVPRRRFVAVTRHHHAVQPRVEVAARHAVFIGISILPPSLNRMSAGCASEWRTREGRKRCMSVGGHGGGI